MAEATAQEQLFLELINRARLDPVAEAARYGIALNQGLAPGTITAAGKQVLAFNPLLNDAADSHSTWMLAEDQFSHTGAGGSDPGDRMGDAGYGFSGNWTWGENIAWSGTTGNLNITQSVYQQHENLFLSAGHRENILGASFREVGVGAITGSFTTGSGTYNALMTTEAFAASGNNRFITGVTYDDDDGNDFYSIGEGAGGRSVQLLQGGSLKATAASGTAGGYGIGTAISGAVEVRFSGAGLASPQGVAVTLSGSNIKLDLVDGGTILSNVPARLTLAALNLTLIGIGNAAGTGTNGANVLTGNSGNNILSALSGNDTVSGGAGNDRLIGGLGADRLLGGAGADIFSFRSAVETAGDLIRDFSGVADRIDLSVIDAVTGGLDNAFHLVAGGTAAFSHAAGELRYQRTPSRTLVQGDVDGDGVADFVIVLDGLHTLTGADFIL